MFLMNIRTLNKIGNSRQKMEVKVMKTCVSLVELFSNGIQYFEFGEDYDGESDNMEWLMSFNIVR